MIVGKRREMLYMSIKGVVFDEQKKDSGQLKTVVLFDQKSPLSALVRVMVQRRGVHIARV